MNYETVDDGNQWQIIDVGETNYEFRKTQIVEDIATLSSSKKYILTTSRGALYGNEKGMGVVNGDFVSDDCFLRHIGILTENAIYIMPLAIAF